MRAAGVNRISFGVQSLDDRSLAILERVHSAEKKRKRRFGSAKNAGFENISIDLCTICRSRRKRAGAIRSSKSKPSLSNTSLSYNLTIEPAPSFHKRGVQAQGGKLSLRFLHLGLEAFEKIGLARYEISAFCKAGFESRHNLGYWTARPFLGFGPSAFSYWEGERFRNAANIQRYARALKNNESRSISANHSPTQPTSSSSSPSSSASPPASTRRLQSSAAPPSKPWINGPNRLSSAHRQRIGSPSAASSSTTHRLRIYLILFREEERNS